MNHSHDNLSNTAALLSSKASRPSIGETTAFDDNVFETTSRNLYILPTRIGLYLCLILIALFSIAVKYSNQPAFIMLFLLVSITLIAMHHTRDNVRKLKLEVDNAGHAFQGEPINFNATISNLEKQAKNSIWLCCLGFREIFTLHGNHSCSIEISLPTIQRGLYKCPSIVFTSQFPLGLFFSWSKRFNPILDGVVFPAPIDYRIEQKGYTEEHDDNSQIQRTNDEGDDEFSGLTPYEPGDRLRDINWPAYARTEKLSVIKKEHQDRTETAISWFDLPDNLSIEEKLQQLSFWIVKANGQNKSYQLVMPGQTTEISNGRAHYHECLKILALW